MVQEKDPKRWDEVIIDSPFAKLTKKDVHEYYSTPAVQKKILDAVGDREAILRQSFTADKTVLRRKDEAGELIRLNKEQLDKWNAKRLSEVHPTFGRKTDVLLADIDPQEGVDWRHTKKITETVAKTMQSRPEVRDVSVRFSGGRGFYVEGKLDAPVGVDHARNLTKQVLDGLAQRHDVYFQPVGPGKIRLDTTPLKFRGSIRSPYSLHSETGLVSAPVKIEDLPDVQKKDFTVDKVLERMREKKAAQMSFPQPELKDLWMRLEKNKPIITTRVEQEHNRYNVGDVVTSPLGKLRVTARESLDDVAKHPFHKELTAKQTALLRGKPYDVLTLEREKKSQHTLITGRPGSGKTTYLRELEKQTGLPSIHIDSVPERQTAWRQMIDAKQRMSAYLKQLENGTTSLEPNFSPEDFHTAQDRLVNIENRIMREALARKTPHLIEGWQLMDLDPKMLAPHRRILIDTGRQRSIDQLVARSLQRDPTIDPFQERLRAEELAGEAAAGVKRFRSIPGTEIKRPRKKEAMTSLPPALLDEVSKDKWATRAYGHKTLREIKEGKRDVVPIEDKGEVVGFMAPNETRFGHPSTGFVYVAQASRGKGLAAKVLAEYAKKNPSAISYLHRDNIASQKAHQKAGWEDTGAAARGNPRARVWRVKQATATLKTELLPHQQRVVDRMATQPGLVVAHGTGSGKTLSSLAALVQENKPSLVLVPASLVSNYKKEQAKHVRGRLPATIGSQQRAVRMGSLPATHMLVVDEAHRARNESAFQDLLQNAQAEKRLLLTASPVYNSPSDIAPLVNIAAGERVLPIGRDFDTKFVEKPSRGWGSLIRAWMGGETEARLKNTPKLQKVLNNWVDYHANAGGEFPRSSTEHFQLAMTPRQTELHNLAWGKLPLMARLRLAASLPPDKKDLAAINAFQSQARQVSGSDRKFLTGDQIAEPAPKILDAVKKLKSQLGKDDTYKALVYSNYLATLGDYATQLEKEKIPFGVFTGEQSTKERDALVKNYNAGDLKALLVSSAGGEGLDLKGTRAVQVLEPHWNEEKLQQVIGRAIRHQSHAELPEDKRHVAIQRFESYPKPGFFRSLVGSKPTGVEQVLSRMSENKQRLNTELLGLLKQSAARTKIAVVPRNVKQYRRALDLVRKGKQYAYHGSSFPNIKSILESGEVRVSNKYPLPSTFWGYGAPADPWGKRNVLAVPTEHVLRYKEPPEIVKNFPEAIGGILPEAETTITPAPGFAKQFLRVPSTVPVPERSTLIAPKEKLRELRDLIKQRKLRTIPQEQFLDTTLPLEELAHAPWQVQKLSQDKLGSARKEFAPGIPANRKIHKIPKVKNPQPWTLAIQKHDADKAGTHFDLRLIPPKGNKAHSWAIPKAKLPKRGVMQLAIQQPTHTREYATTFSGKIPKGTYGAGKVTMHTNEPVTVLSAGDNRVKFRRASGEQFTLFRTKEKQWGITKTAAEVIDEWRRKKREAKVTAFIRERMR